MRVRVGNVQVDLTPEQADDLRRQLGIERHDADGMLTAAQVAERFGVSTDHVYSHASELGGVKLGDSPKAPWRFDPAKLPGAASAAAETAPPAPAKGKRKRRRGGETGLLAIRGSRPYPQQDKSGDPPRHNASGPPTTTERVSFHDG